MKKQPLEVGKDQWSHARAKPLKNLVRVSLGTDMGTTSKANQRREVKVVMKERSRSQQLCGLLKVAMKGKASKRQKINLGVLAHEAL